MLEVRGVHKSFAETPLLKNINLSVESGEYLGLIGPSGTGKSILLKIVSGILDSDSGSVELKDENNRKSSIGFLFQSGALFDSMSVLENTMFPIQQEPDLSYEEAAGRAYELLSIVGLAKSIYKLPGQLSGGMQRRVALARALVANPKLVLLDDPTAGLDPVAANVIMDLIETLHKRYHPTILLVSHDLRRLIPHVDRLVCLFDGEVVFDDKKSNIVNAPKDVLSFVSTRFNLDELNAS